MDSEATTPTNVFLTDATTGLALTLARRLATRGFGVAGVVEDVAQAHRLRDAGGVPAYPQLRRSGELRSTLQALESQVVVHLAPVKTNHVPFFSADWEAAGRLLMDGTPAIVEAAQAAGVEFIVMLSYAFVYGDRHGQTVDEDAVWEHVDEPLVRAALQAERMVLSSGVPACVLRAGFHYGPASAETVRLRDSLVAGRGTALGDADAYAGWIHVDDLAGAIVAAVEKRPEGAVLNIVDDTPAPTTAFAGYLAESMHISPPSGPGLLARLTTSRTHASLLGASARASNRRAKEVLGWAPQYPGYRQGLDQTLLHLRAEEPVV